ncbi:PepSY domain-containing protein [Streptomyces ardesiacus]|uniref:PepSY domain-containing protein n=1 Tax=Streptomyces ardesiacus TaxID=285564 RepID=UPI00201F566C|nr:PepSY domain-containing protein [Streptomyces ardesiacus]MCL7368750.1 PepSY domain-containing protein [Streptomyces ardesiacus]
MKRKIVIAALAAAALAGGGTATALATTGDDGRGTAPRADVSVPDDGGVRDEADDRENDRDDDREDGARAASAEVTAADALAAALADTPGTAVSAELDDEDDDGDRGDGDDRRQRAAWEVDVLAGDGTWHDVRVDAVTGKVLGSERDDDEDDTAEVRAALKGTSVDAAAAARAAAGHGTVTSVELDEDGHYGDGRPAWEVETYASGKGEREWRVDARTGKVTADRSHDRHDSRDGEDADDAHDAHGSDDD